MIWWNYLQEFVQMSVKTLFAQILADNSPSKNAIMHDFDFMQFFAQITEKPICANGFFVGQQNMPALPTAPQISIGAYRIAEN